MDKPLTVDDPVVDFTLRGTDGREYSSQQAREQGLLLFAFYKRTCPVCQLTMPFLERFHEQYASDGAFQVWGVAQENEQDAKDFAAAYGASFPQLMDEGYRVSAEYRLEGVPELYLVDASGRILRHAPAFMTDEFNTMALTIADRTGQPFEPVVRPEDNAPVFKPG